MVFDDATAECLVFSFKEGLLSAAAHDLQLRATGFSITLSDDRTTLDAAFPARGVRVVAAMVDGKPRDGVLSQQQRAEIEGNLQRAVLDGQHHPDIRVRVAGLQPGAQSFSTQAQVTLHGQTRPVVLQVRRDGNRWRAQATLQQTAFGIRPFSALMGTLRIRDAVQVHISFPA